MKDAGAGAGRQSDLCSQRFEPCAVRVRQDHSPHMGCRNRLLALESRTAKMVGWCLSFRILDATIQQIASPCVAVNGRDKRRAQRAAIDCPAWVRCAVTKAGKAKGACPPPLTSRERNVLSRHGSACAPMPDDCKAESLAIPHIL